MKTACYALAASCALAGCISPENDRITLGRSMRLAIFERTTPSPATAIPSTLVAPSVVNIERDNWKRTEILVPVDGSAHNPTYARRIIEANRTRRQRDLYPTPSSALELSEGSEGQQQREALYNILRSASDVVLLLPRMIWRAPWRTDVSPDEAYARSWRPKAAPGEREALPEDGDPFAPPKPRSITP